MKKKYLSVLLAAAMVTGTLAGCGNSSSDNPSSSSEKDSDSSEGKIINIYSWNDEFAKRVNKIYPEVKKVSKDGTVTTLKDGTEIHWIINPNQDGVYQQKLDEALLNQESAAADDKISFCQRQTM